MALQDYQVKISETGEELLQHGTALFPIACYLLVRHMMMVTSVRDILTLRRRT